MLSIANTEVFGWDAAIRGMRNPLNSWDKSDSCWGLTEDESPFNPSDTPFYYIGANDFKLMKTLANAGTDHRKYLRMINVTTDINAPLYWWKEYDTYKVGTVANSCSTMHKIQAKEFTLDDFSHEHMDILTTDIMTQHIIPTLNIYRKLFCGIESGTRKGEKSDWWQMIQLLPSSYNQKRTIQLNYEVLVHIYYSRKNHKLDEWHTFCDWIELLPYFKDIILRNEGKE